MTGNLPKATPVKQIFISHATADAEFAHRLADDLEWCGVQVWIAPDCILPGEAWVDAIERGLQESSHVLVILTPAAVESSWVKKETSIAISQQLRGRMQVIPLEVKPCEVPLLLDSYQTVSFRRDYSAGLNQLTDILRLRNVEPPPARPAAVGFKRLRTIRLPAGHGNQLREDMVELVRDLHHAIPAAFDSEDCEQHAETIVREMEGARNEIFEQLEAEVSRRGFVLVRTDMGVATAPVIEGQVLSPEQYAQLPDDAKSRIEEHHQDLQREMRHAMRESRAIERKAKEQTHNFVREIASFIVGDYIDSLKEKYAAFDEVLEYLHEVQRGLIEDVSDFLPKDDEEEKLDTINTE